MTPLDKWLKTTETMAQSICDKTGIHKSRLSRIRSGLSMPTVDEAIKIEDATGKGVQVREWVSKQ